MVEESSRIRYNQYREYRMKFFLNPRDRAELHQLFQTNERNYAVTDLLSTYFHSCARSLTKKEIFQEMEKRGGDEETAFFFCLMRLMNVDPGEYGLFDSIRKGIHRLDPSRYEKNPFLQHIRFPESWKGNARFFNDSYLPYEGFPYADIEVDPDDAYREICSVGFFTRRYAFPSLIQNGVTWMSLIPNEIETMRSPIASAKGNVLVYGLGIGYYAYMIHLKEEVRTVTIVEKDRRIIDLFDKHLYRQFPYPEKIRVIRADALQYEKESNDRYDMAFVDLYHDEKDGIPLYRKFKKAERRADRYEYWLEKSLIEGVRRALITLLNEQYFRLNVDYVHAENDNDDLINALYRYFSGTVFRSYREIKEMLSEESVLKAIRNL